MKHLLALLPTLALGFSALAATPGDYTSDQTAERAAATNPDYAPSMPNAATPDGTTSSATTSAGDMNNDAKSATAPAQDKMQAKHAKRSGKMKSDKMGKDGNINTTTGQDASRDSGMDKSNK